jgi:serine protease AprX
MAPGVKITAARANSGTGYVAYNGTSMATPFAAGVAALMQAASYQTVGTVKSNLMSTAQDWRDQGDDIDYGSGRLQAYEAIKKQGALAGTNIATPGHFAVTQTISGSGGSDWYDLSITTTGYPIGLTLIIPAASSSMDFDLYLHDPSGTLVARSTTTNRQEQIAYKPRTTGIFRVRVHSYAGSGSYHLDTSAGASDQAITLDQ